MQHLDLTPFYVILSIISVFIILLAVITADDMIRGRKRRRELEEANKNSEYDNLLISARLQLRERIIKYVRKEIHRSISVDLVAAKRMLGSLLKNFHPDQSSDINASIDLLTKSIEGLRRVEKDFVTDVIREDGLLEIIRQEKLKIEKFYGATVEYRTIGEPIILDDEKELVIFSIIQEALINALRSGNEAVIGLKLCYSSESLIIEIANYVKGFDPSHFLSNDQARKGFPDITKRAALLNGWCQFDKTRDNAIWIQIPY